MRKVLTLMLLFMSLACMAQLETFKFRTTEFSAVDGQSVFPSAPKRACIEVNVADKDLVVVGEGEYKLGEFSGFWSVNSMGALEVNGSDDSKFVISRDGKINIVHGNSLLNFNTPASLAQYKNEYDRLYLYLKKIEKLNSGAGRTEQPSAGIKGEIKIPENVSVLDAVTKIFGFIPFSEATKSYCEKIAKSAGWVGYFDSLHPDIFYAYDISTKVSGLTVGKYMVRFKSDGKIKEYSMKIKLNRSSYSRSNALAKYNELKTALAGAGYRFSADTLSGYLLKSHVGKVNGQKIELYISDYPSVKYYEISIIVYPE